MSKDNREIEVFKQEYSTIMGRWQKENKDLLKQVDEISQELDPLNDKKEPLSDDEKKQQKELTAKREKAQKAVDSAANDLHVTLMGLVPSGNVTKDEMNDLLKWMKKTFETIKKGLPVTKSFTIEPDLDVNMSKLQIKSLGVNLIWKF
jgi:hypothetical protein